MASKGRPLASFTPRAPTAGRGREGNEPPPPSVGLPSITRRQADRESDSLNIGSLASYWALTDGEEPPCRYPSSPLPCVLAKPRPSPNPSGQVTWLNVPHLIGRLKLVAGLWRGHVTGD